MNVPPNSTLPSTHARLSAGEGRLETTWEERQIVVYQAGDAPKTPPIQEIYEYPGYSPPPLKRRRLEENPPTLLDRIYGKDR